MFVCQRGEVKYKNTLDLRQLCYARKVADISTQQLTYLFTMWSMSERNDSNTLFTFAQQKYINVVVVVCVSVVRNHFLNLISTKSQIVTSQHGSIAKLQNDCLRKSDTQIFIFIFFQIQIHMVQWHGQKFLSCAGLFFFNHDGEGTINKNQ